jgi:hypothetical protein
MSAGLRNGNGQEGNMKALLGCAIFLGAACVSLSTEAEDLWGCQVLLCLSNPDGPEALTECQPPIERLWEHLRHGNSFPSCPSGGSAYARPTSSYYDLCPAGTTELPSGQLGAAASAKRMIYYGIGDGGNAAQWEYGGMQTQIPSKVCVGRRVGQGIEYLPTQGGGERGGPNYQAHVVGYYDQLVVLPAHSSPRVIDVYIDNARYKRVRW